MTVKARILLVDDHALVRTGIKRVLEEIPDWTVCGEAGDGQEAVEKALQLQPDLVLMDITMPVMNGIEATKQIRRLAPQMRIAMLSMHDAPQIVEQARLSGANAYLVKASEADELRDAVAAVLQHDPGHFTEF